jgi:hypothetical protein
MEVAAWLRAVLVAGLIAPAVCAQGPLFGSPRSDDEAQTDSGEIAAGDEGAPGTKEADRAKKDAAKKDASAGKDDQEKAKEQEKKAKEKKKQLADARAGAYKILFYDNDFRYLEDPAYHGYDLGDDLKRLHPLDCVTLDFGGQYRARYQHENNMRGLGLTGRDDDFLLQRTRLFANAEACGLFRAYVEYLDATSSYEEFAPRIIEEDRSELLNLFGDALLWEDCRGKLWARVGRQELLYGNQRLISPLDWANTRRTFQGYKLFWRGKDWDVDGFWTNPVGPDPRNFDKPNQDIEFMGVYSVYKGVKDQTLDLYWLRLINNAFEFGVQNAFDFDTLGARWYGTRDNWLWEFEGGYQFGRNTDGSAHAAGAWTLGVGRKADHCWQPTLWAYLDWASGGDVLAAGNGWHHQFPLSHKYLGFMDFFGRRNIMTPNLLFTVKPHEKVTLLVWYYHFLLQTRTDTPYTVVMTPFNPANAPGSRDLGDEIDLLLTWNVTARINMLFGYSHFFRGDYYRTTPGVPIQADADFFYTHVEWNF